ncbi:transcription factor mitochondrial [Brachionus plicatilis]|uniref:Transcription factor mitochondrial n=1 Tax=Brachionus plicatilis TaxID=10195 RepID=A0A3M7SSN0_BRAPC|nr:transcription factor mitochondrial [Brachionus plicatilis]
MNSRKIFLRQACLRRRLTRKTSMVARCIDKYSTTLNSSRITWIEFKLDHKLFGFELMSITSMNFNNGLNFDCLDDIQWNTELFISPKKNSKSGFFFSKSEQRLEIFFFKKKSGLELDLRFVTFKQYHEVIKNNMLYSVHFVSIIKKKTQPKMLKNLIFQSSRCFTKLNLLPKQLTLVNLKYQTTISNYHDIEGYKPVFMNYSTSVSYPKDYLQKIIDIQRHEKITPYLFFVKEQLKFNNHNGNLDVSQKKKIKEIGERWTSMSEADKKAFLIYKIYLLKYIDLSVKNREDLTQQKKNLLSTLNEDEKKLQRFKKLKEIRIKKEKIKQNAPKRPKGAFILYCDSLDRGDAHVKDFLRGAAAKWKQMAEQDRQKFFFQANELMEQYKIDYTEWEKKMIEKGKKNLLRKKSVAEINSTSLKKPKNKRAKNMMTKSAKRQSVKKSAKKTDSTIDYQPRTPDSNNILKIRERGKF